MSILIILEIQALSSVRLPLSGKASMMGASSLQSPRSEYGRYSKLLSEGHLQLENTYNGQQHKGEVRGSIDNARNDVDRIDIEATTWCSWIPEFAPRRADKYCNKHNCSVE